MKILYDHQAFTMQRYGGVSRCFVELVNNLNADVDVDANLNPNLNADANHNPNHGVETEITDREIDKSHRSLR